MCLGDGGAINDMVADNEYPLKDCWIYGLILKSVS